MLRHPARRAPALALALATALPALTACQPDGVRISYRPRPGDRHTYRVVVHAEVETTIGDTPPRRTVEDDVLIASHRVLSANRDGSRVEVRLRGAGEPTRTFVVRLDRAGNLAEVQRVEGLPARALGGLGLSEIFPVAAGSPPARRLSPGDRWRLDEAVALPGAAPSSPPTRLRGEGWLVELGVVGGADVARTVSSFRVPVRRESDEPQGRLVIAGEQVVTQVAAARVQDGSAQEVETETRGAYSVRLLPTAAEGQSVPGRVVVSVRSTTVRLR